MIFCSWKVHFILNTLSNFIRLHWWSLRILSHSCPRIHKLCSDSKIFTVLLQDSLTPIFKHLLLHVVQLYLRHSFKYAKHRRTLGTNLLQHQSAKQREIKVLKYTFISLHYPYYQISSTLRHLSRSLFFYILSTDQQV